MLMLLKEDPFLVHIPESKEAFVFWSGGLDSTTLIYLLRTWDVKVTALVFKDRCFVDIVENLAKRHNIDYQYLERTETGHDIRNDVLHFTSKQKQVCYIGVTKNLDFEHDFPPRRPKIKDYPLENIVVQLPYLYMPFANTTKDFIFKLATKLKIDFESTHSCTENKVPCGYCYACVERKIAHELFVKNFAK